MAIAAQQQLSPVPRPGNQFSVPINDVAEPEVSIIVPALGDEITMGDLVDSCKTGLAKAGTAGEILIVVSSADQTAGIARSRGARVLKTLRRGLGQAYIDAIPYVRGRYVLLNDACDFREISDFVKSLRAGAEFVMGARWRGMHCGLRGITRQALADMRLESQSWEYASEMVLKSTAMGLRTAEVPFAF